MIYQIRVSQICKPESDAPEATEATVLVNEESDYDTFVPVCVLKVYRNHDVQLQNVIRMAVEALNLNAVQS